MVEYSTRDYAQLIRVYSKKDTGFITGKWWPNSVLINKRVSFTTVSVILSIPYRGVGEGVVIVFVSGPAVAVFEMSGTG
jgi:hypothetical protein